MVPASQVAAPHMMELLYHHGPSLSALPYDEALAGAVLGSYVWCSSVRRWKRWTSWDWMVVYDGESGPFWNDTFTDSWARKGAFQCHQIRLAGKSSIHVFCLMGKSSMSMIFHCRVRSQGTFNTVIHRVSPRYSSHTDMSDLAMHQDRPKSGLWTLLIHIRVE